MMFTGRGTEVGDIPITFENTGHMVQAQNWDLTSNMALKVTFGSLRDPAAS
jgi:hypothetical protein